MYKKILFSNTIAIESKEVKICLQEKRNFLYYLLLSCLSPAYFWPGVAVTKRNKTPHQAIAEHHPHKTHPV